MKGPCMCGDPYCPSCGPAQGFPVGGPVDFDPDVKEHVHEQCWEDARDSGWNPIKNEFGPGKHQGNPYWIPYIYHQIVLDGCGDGPLGGYEWIELTPAEKECFGGAGAKDWVGIKENDDGFVMWTTKTDAEYEQLCKEHNQWDGYP